VSEARTWIGTPWQHQARSRGAGVDCAGLVIGVARALGLVPTDMDVNHYSRMPDGHSLLAHCGEWMHRIHADDAQPGDVLVMRFDMHPQHLAIVADYLHGGLSIVHALDCRDRKRARVLEHRLAPELRSKIVAAYVLPGVA
jgi:NlpC/P60 family putative phage cell wall peptidase